MGNGTGGESIYGHDFEDENFDVKHDGPGIVSMANSGPNTNGSQFLICFRTAPQLDGRHVAFGKVVGGWDVVQKVEACGTVLGEERAEGAEEGLPTKRISIADCGEVEQADKKVKRAKLAQGDVAWTLHILRKHSGCKKPTSWRQETITCSQDEASKFLNDLRTRLLKTSGDARKREFEQLAREHSDCKSAKKGGDLGPFERGMMQKPF
eukprot:SRR837773.17504.p1 GENE.SRR837773.17504~~SRR837773.17504.p1  ORF type:complete len:209 (-),score=33.21 SRR837773.17504:56-682(-)